MTPIAFDSFDASLGRLTGATLAFDYKAIYELAVSVRQAPAEGPFGQILTYGLGVAMAAGDRFFGLSSGEPGSVACIVPSGTTSCLAAGRFEEVISGRIDVLDLANDASPIIDLNEAQSFTGFFSHDGVAGARPLFSAASSINWTGELTLTYTYEEQVPIVPEPSSWAMMLAGFGLIGMAVRRGRRRFVFSAG